MFDDDNFEPTYVEIPKTTQDMEGIPGPQTKKMRYDTLKRGVTERADRLLDLLVCGLQHHWMTRAKQIRYRRMA
jgi:hypothetical protein